MNKPAKIKYDWNLQYEVTINTLPDGFDDLVSIDIIGDENQPGYTGTGKFWFNKNSELIIRAKDSDCMILSGYRDNTIFPQTTTLRNEKYIASLENIQNISWIYSNYMFDETVILGSPVMLSSIPPNIRNQLDFNNKPEFNSGTYSEDKVL
jgi:hypothetical protein